ncbi:hypothetical protein NEOLEDRAFT_1129436 [Neolentinus lepideus HHB14362 ss-1]|uniref:Secreted protein n=1 Tax=Neolentinus lepideus HHB14362 ss-1 TaxID=1314782 RepID=A0A165URW3_9AGAM|nr:hypothetical protein NEOLEDRAFT_1129436 [Neolentinus lepideus HHB14362 ss-1]
MTVETVVFISLALDLFAFTIPLPQGPQVMNMKRKYCPQHHLPPLCMPEQCNALRLCARWHCGVLHSR